VPVCRSPSIGLTRGASSGADGAVVVAAVMPELL